MPIDFECNLAEVAVRLARTRAHAAGSGRALLALRALSSNPQDSFGQSFAAAYPASVAPSVDLLVSGYSFWTGTDIFEENYLPRGPLFGGSVR